MFLGRVKCWAIKERVRERGRERDSNREGAK